MLAQVVEMRYFAGYSETEVAELMGTSERTVRRQWDKARLFLLVSMQPRGATALSGFASRLR